MQQASRKRRTLFRVGAGTLTEVATSDSGHWCQGATWSNNGKVILLQCATEREIEVFRFDGKSLVQDKAASMPSVKSLARMVVNDRANRL